MSTDPLILYGMGSPNVTKVVLALEELGLPYELRLVAVLRAEQFTPEFLALNPLGKVPVLVDPRLGQPLAESGAILHWLAEREGRFLPATQPARAEVMQWLMIQMANMGPMFGQLAHFTVLPKELGSYGRKRYKAQSEKLHRLLDDRLAAHEWVAGDAYSIADMAIWPWAHYLEWQRFDPAGYPALVRWRERIDARPAAIRARARMEEAFAAGSLAARDAATPADLDRFFGRTDDMPPIDYSAILSR